MLLGFGFALRQVLYDLRAGMLWRPALITASYAALGLGAVAVERRFAPAGGWWASWFSGGDPAAAQIALGTVAGSMMTIVSIVYSLLIMALSLASVQFSPRILTSFVRDRTSQTTLGVFVGTFTYSLMVLRSIQAAPAPFLPAASVSLGMVLALAALGWLLYFIHHIAQGIQVNHIVDRIARETLDVIDHEFPVPVRATGTEADRLPSAPADAAVIEAPASGYVQLVDHQLLLGLASEHGLTIFARRGVGQFVVEGNPLVHVDPAVGATDAVREACTDAFDIGPVRTMQQDVEFGIRQIVDMALKAISPAVNDPSTAATCLDHLGRILCHLARRHIPAGAVRDGRSGRLLLVRRAVTLDAAIDLAFNQIRQYGSGDMAVALRLLRALEEVALAAPAHRGRLLRHAELLSAALDPRFQGDDTAEFRARHAALRVRCQTPSTPADAAVESGNLSTSDGS